MDKKGKHIFLKSKSQLH